MIILRYVCHAHVMSADSLAHISMYRWLTCGADHAAGHVLPLTRACMQVLVTIVSTMQEHIDYAVTRGVFRMGATLLAGTLGK